MRKKIKPPFFAKWFLKKMTRYKDKHSIEGDFEETFIKMAVEKNKLRAQCWYWAHVLKSFSSYFKLSVYMGTVMIKNYFKISVRNIRNNIGYTVLNVSGLAAGIASCILILLYVQYELSFDSSYENAKNIYRIGMEERNQGRIRYWGWTSVLLADVLKSEFPEVLESTRLLNEMGETQISYNDIGTIEKEVLYADSRFFDIFSIPLVKGNPKKVLENPSSVVISQTTAERYFSNEDPVGKTLVIRNWYADNTDHIITGVVEDIPRNSHFHFDFLISYNSSRVSESDNWFYTQIFNYFLLRDDTDYKIFESKLPSLVEKYEAPLIKESRNITYEEYLAQGYGTRLFLQPLKDIHLKSELEHELEPVGRIAYIYMFSLIGVFILFIACVNFMNLSTARSINRAKEVGVRKALGSFRKQLVIQFLFESTFLSFLALFIALGIVEFILPYFKSFTHTDLNIRYFNDIRVIPGLTTFALTVGLLSGTYPAFFLSSFSPVSVLKSKLRTNSKGSIVRNGLVVFQFASSIALISGTLIIANQIDYMQNKNLGYDKDHVIIISNARALNQQVDSFKNELKKYDPVISAAGSGEYPARAIHAADFRVRGIAMEKPVSMFNTSVDYDFAETLGLEMTQGRFYSRDIVSDTSAVVINESAVNALGLTEPLGKILDAFRPSTIIGVVKDFNFRSLHNDIGPLVLYLHRWNRIGYISVRIHGYDISKTLSDIKNVWEKFAGGQPFNYSFLDQDIEQLYNSETRAGQISGIFSLLAIMIGCLGLFGLAAYTAEQRTKEIGIRKVLGATVTNVLLLLSGNLIKLVLLAFVVAVPVSYYIMSEWLHNFAYRINLGVFPFLLAGGLTMLIALLTVSFQVLKAASANPVEALRFE